MLCRHGPTYHTALDMLLLPEGATEPRSEGHSYVTQKVENCNQTYNCYVKL